jgi:hypothetical protein
MQASDLGSVVEASRWGVDRIADAIRVEFGRTAVGYSTVALSVAERVPDKFREWAERDQAKASGEAKDVLVIGDQNAALIFQGDRLSG